MLLFAIFMILFSSASAYVLEEECLNYTVYPVQYELSLTPHIYKDGNSYYDCDIVITVIANGPNVNIIELDAKDLEIKRDSVQVWDGSVNLVNEYRPYEFDNAKGKLFIYLREPLKQYSVSRKQYFIKISFIKRVGLESDGIFLTEYDEYGRAQYLFTTRLSPNKAKYFFPCFENPQFEAVFKFKVYVATPHLNLQNCNTSLVIAEEQKRQSSSNSYTIIEYTPSPQVALYQVGFHHSKFGSRQNTANKTNDTLIIWAPGPSLKHYDFILIYGETIINLLHEYAGVNRPLVNGPINIVAVPKIIHGYETGSWNLLTNSDTRLSHINEFTSIEQTEQMKFELAQQLSRIWLGNPGEVQRTRWKEEWFKEGVAGYLAYYLLTQYNNGMVSYNQRLPIAMYGLKMKHKAMAVDWAHSTPALASFNRTLAIEIPTRYKELVTMKTASLLWMVENWLGSEKFHQALVNYINSRRGQYISLIDFMASLDRDTVECFHQFFNGSTSSRVLNSWFHQSGYPVVNVLVLRDRTPNAVQLKQVKFSFIEKDRHDSNYLIPISYIVQHNQNCFNCFQPRFTIGSQTYTFGENLNGGWIILNRNASGYYRVNYDEETWRLIAKALQEDHTSIDELNRAQIANDVLALYAAGSLREDIALEVLDYLNKEISHVVWDAVISGFHFLQTEGVKMTRALYEEWKQFMQNKVSTIYKRLTMSLEQRSNTRLFRSAVVQFACSVGHQPCLQEMTRHYREHSHSNKRLNPDYRETCYFLALSSGKTDVSGKNRFELEDKMNAEHRLRLENKFLYRIPKGEPKPLPYMKSTTTSTTEIAVISTPQVASKGTTSLVSWLTILITVVKLMIFV
ncbi:aminopeptidase N-like [Maniola jurtina]|uniref:aminopeptidase N-like n=1 Tax=Maniola jurtina TaxID=191418 RepID=UPI001E68B83E|nr:aminopeptidase N-like [Maniola jurtina]XP_045765669.1 aminopeptidase N-like [Maniola jurtina]XP_045765670.1 aminopeptidase N-like [Maniola jurtina]